MLAVSDVSYNINIVVLIWNKHIMTAWLSVAISNSPEWKQWKRDVT